MDAVSYCALRVSTVVWQPRAGSYALTVVCKATFDLRPGESPLAREQIAPYDADVHRQNDPRLSLLAAGDLVPFKRRADVLVTGQAHAPAGKPTTSLVARLAAGAIDKSIEVHAQRAWMANGRLVMGQPFVHMPLVWERAAYGSSNPVGVICNGPPDARGLRPVPNIVPPGLQLRSPADAIAAVGFGPIAPAWHPRASLLGHDAATWDHRAWNARPMPESFDGAFFNAAPADQQLAELCGNETILLEHLHPEYPKLATTLVKVVPIITVRRQDGRAEEVRVRCDTLCIDTDRAAATLVWRGLVLLAHATEPGTVVVTMAETRADATDLESTLVPATANPGRAEAKPVLPFVRDGGQTSAHDRPELPPGAFRQEQEDDGTGTITERRQPAYGASKAVLPFQSAAAPLVAPPPVQAPPPVAVEPIADDEEPTTWKSRNAAQAVQEHAGADREAAEKPHLADVAPPPMIGPIAVSHEPALDVAGDDREREGESHGEEAGPPEVEPESLPIELTIEQTATIAAELAEGTQERRKVLEAHEVRERAWRVQQARWTAAMHDEADRGTHSLRERYDAAYVARVEQFRGAITVDEYARIVAGLERGKAHPVLDALGIQRAALMPVVRLWTKKVAKDMKLGDATNAALRAAREAS